MSEESFATNGACEAPKETDLYVSTDGFRVFRLDGHDAIGIEAMGMVVVRPVRDWHALATAITGQPALPSVVSETGERNAALEEAALCSLDVYDQGRGGAHAGEQANRTAAAIRALKNAAPQAMHQGVITGWPAVAAPVSAIGQKDVGLLPGLREALKWKPNTPQLENAMTYAWESALKSFIRAIEDAQ